MSYGICEYENTVQGALQMISSMIDDSMYDIVRIHKIADIQFSSLYDATFAYKIQFIAKYARVTLLK